MPIEIKCIVNKPISSNSYIVYNKSCSNSCVVIDPGTEDCTDLISFIEIMNLTPEWIFLTHEHFDHVWGVNKMKQIFGAKIVCSKDCANGIIDKKKNLSIFFNQFGFECYPADIVFEEDYYCFSCFESKFEFYKTEGHSKGSISILFKDNLFSGDLLLENQKTIIKLPGGCEDKLRNSINFLTKKFAKKGIKVHPGHGAIFRFDEYVPSKIKELL